jgi:hypothetical protein
VGEVGDVGGQASVGTGVGKRHELGRMGRRETDGMGTDVAVDEAERMELGEGVGQAGGVWQELFNGHRGAGLNAISDGDTPGPLGHHPGVFTIGTGAIHLEEMRVGNRSQRSHLCQEATAPPLADFRPKHPNEDRPVEREVGGQPLLYIPIAAESDLQLIAGRKAGSHVRCG